MCSRGNVKKLVLHVANPALLELSRNGSPDYNKISYAEFVGRAYERTCRLRSMLQNKKTEQSPSKRALSKKQNGGESNAKI